MRISNVSIVFTEVLESLIKKLKLDFMSRQINSSLNWPRSFEGKKVLSSAKMPPYSYLNVAESRTEALTLGNQR